jgi:hypothetical protein
MANYTVRVELNAASAQDYDYLHGLMGFAGFSRSVRADDGRLFRLPPAEYVLDGSALSIEDVYRLAANSANKTGCSNEVLVNEVVRRYWSLKPVLASPQVNALAGLSAAKTPLSNALNPTAGLGALGFLLDQPRRSVLDGIS